MSRQQTVTREKVVEGPTSSMKTTTYTTSSSYSQEGGGEGNVIEYKSQYRPMMAARTTIINRTAAGYGVGGGVQTRQSGGMNYASMPQVSAGAYANVTAAGVTNIKQSRDKEKKDMRELNERFASYIEKVRFLEAQNRKLADELDKLKQKWGKETTAIKAMFQAELDEARRLLDEGEKEKARLEIRCASLEEQIEDLQKKVADLEEARAQDRLTIENYARDISDLKSEVELLRKRIESLENDHERDKKEIARLTEALNRARIDLDTETLAHVDAENRRQTLEEELEFLKQVHEQEMKELAALAYRDTTSENREFWKNEMAQALREISCAYDEKLDSMRGELETYYNMKVQEFRTGATRQNMEATHAKEDSKRSRNTINDLRAKINDLEMRNAQLEKELAELQKQKDDDDRAHQAKEQELQQELMKLRAEMEAVLKELQDLMDTKLGLELEIAAYRKLLEGEENRAGLKQVVESIIATQERRMQSSEQAMTMYTMRQTEQTSGGGYSSSQSASVSGGGGGGGMGGGSAYSRTTTSSYSSGGGVSGGESGGFGMQQQMMGGQSDQSLKVSQVVKGEMSAKTTYQRSAKGNISIAECAADGKFITLENTGRKFAADGVTEMPEENLSGWTMVRIIDGAEKVRYQLPQNFIIRAGGKVKIWGQGQRGPGAGPNDIEFNLPSWQVGANITTKLINTAGEDRATHVQKTIYTS